MRRPSSSQPASSPEHAPPRDRPTAEGLSPRRFPPARADPGRGSRRRPAPLSPEAAPGPPPRRRRRARIPREGGKEGKPITKPGFSFPPETAGRQEVTKERSSGSLGLGPRSPPDSRNSRSGAERSRAARRPPHLRSRRALARSLARPRARPRHRPAPASRPRPAPSGPGRGVVGQTRAWVSAADGTTGTLDGLSGKDRPVCHRERIAQGTRLEEARFGRRICVPPLSLPS